MALRYAAIHASRPPITRNQIELMSIDNIASPACPGFGTLGIEPAGIEAVWLGEPAVTLSRRGVERLREGHVWVYRSDLRVPAGLKGGEVVSLDF